MSERKYILYDDDDCEEKETSSFILYCQALSFPSHYTTHIPIIESCFFYYASFSFKIYNNIKFIIFFSCVVFPITSWSWSLIDIIFSTASQPACLCVFLISFEMRYYYYCFHILIGLCPSWYGEATKIIKRARQFLLINKCLLLL